MKESVIAPLLPPLLVQPYHPRLQPPHSSSTNHPPQCYNGPPLQLDELASTAATTTTSTTSIVNMIRNSSSEEEDNSNTHNNNVVSTVENSSPKSQTNPTTNTTTSTTTTTRGYTDHAQEIDPTERIQATYGNQSMSIIQHEDETTRSLAIQKLPSKLAAMLSDPDLITCITWLPHGRSWKILNRDLFSSYALPRYFGHTNHSSFVRVVNAWGFRRIVSGPDRDSYYHELFLRGKPNLYARMRRLGNSSGGGGRSGGKREEVEVDFYELAKTSPLPENMWRYRPQAMNNGGVGSGRMGTSGGGGASGSGQMSSFGGMSAAMAQGMMSGMMGGAAGTMGMYPSAMSSASAYGTSASSMTNSMMSGYSGSSSWNPTTTTTSGAPTTTATGSTTSMMGMPSSMTSRQMSFDGSTTTTSASARVPQDGSTNRMSTANTNMPQLLAALRQDPSQTATATTTTTNTTSSNTITNNNSEEMERLMNQNQLLKALLKRTQEAVAASRMKDGSS